MRHLPIALIALALAAVAGEHPAAPASPAARGEIALATPGEPGEPFVLEGRLVSLPDSLPLRDAVVYLYHADAHGKYSEKGAAAPRLAGTVRTNVVGGFRVRTVFPGLYDGTPHLHYEVRGPRAWRKGTISLCRRHGAGSDSAFARVPWMVTVPSPDGWAYVERDGDGHLRASWTLGLRAK